MPAAPRSRSNRVSLERHRDPTLTLDQKLVLRGGVLAAFRDWDKSGSGTISLPELKAVLVGLGVPEEDVPKLFSLGDCNKDGQIDYEEFVSWLWVVAPAAIRRAGGSSETAAAVAEELAKPRAAERGGHPAMSPMPAAAADEPVILATCKLAAPVCPALDFTLKVAPSTRISELAQRICENHGGSIAEPAICVGRFHPAEVKAHSVTLRECGVMEGECIVYYDYAAQAGAVLA